MAKQRGMHSKSILAVSWPFMVHTDAVRLKSGVCEGQPAGSGKAWSGTPRGLSELSLETPLSHVARCDEFREDRTPVGYARLRTGKVAHLALRFRVQLAIKSTSYSPPTPIFLRTSSLMPIRLAQQRTTSCGWWAG